MSCKRCNSPIEEKVEKVFYCDECLIMVAEAAQKIRDWIDRL